MPTQRQDVRENGAAIQSGGDTNIIIHHGISSSDMTAIMSALVAAQLPAYAALARQIVDERLQELQDKVLERFATSPTARPEAFGDPDFQYSITRAQHAFARSGDPVIRDTLVDLIERRSRENTRTRLALALNEAMERSAYLTREEFAGLTLVYLCKYAVRYNIINLDTFKEHLHLSIYPLLPDISRENSSYQLIEAQSCGSIVNFGRPDFHRCVTTAYGGVFSKGFSREQLENHVPEKDVSPLERVGLIGPCLNDPGALQLMCRSRDVFRKMAETTGMPENVLQNVWSLFERTFWTKEELLDHIGEPELRELYSLWDTTPLHALDLNAVGIAIGHANATRVCALNADLSIWIK